MKKVMFITLFFFVRMATAEDFTSRLPDGWTEKDTETLVESTINDGGFHVSATATQKRMNVNVLRMPMNVEDDEMNSFFGGCARACISLSEIYPDDYIMKINFTRGGYLWASMKGCKEYKNGGNWPFNLHENTRSKKATKTPSKRKK
ncbi:MAG: hypothetical protein M0Z38_13100 [Deltaproteobacteria bacterium]|nr:hypothetical protein [Deltaproteobacteria bacterium]